MKVTKHTAHELTALLSRHRCNTPLDWNTLDAAIEHARKHDGAPTADHSAEQLNELRSIRRAAWASFWLKSPQEAP